MFQIVGSQAGLMHKIIPNRKPLDWDIIGTVVGVDGFLRANGVEAKRIEQTKKGYNLFSQEGNIFEVELAERCDNVAEILDRMVESHKGQLGWLANPEWLYFLKMSHRYRKDSPHFWKTRFDIQHMRKVGVGMPVDSEELLKERERLTYVNKLPNLNQKSETFFKKEDGFYVYDHDSIHRAVAMLDKPAYLYYMSVGASVQSDKEKFFSSPESVKLLGVYEESCVLALERSLIPFDFEPDPKEAFVMALSKVCSSITGGWFREYAWENCFRVLSIYDKLGGRYVNDFRIALESGKILPFEKENY